MSPQVWLITGTTSAFGLEFVTNLLARGDKVIATAGNVDQIAYLEKDGAVILKLDLANDQATFNKQAEAAIAIYGKIDVLVNNDGCSHFGTVEDDSREDWDWMKQFQTHVFGPLGVARAFLPHFRAKKAGTIVFIGSTAGWGGSKNALRGAVETLELEVIGFGINTLL